MRLAIKAIVLLLISAAPAAADHASQRYRVSGRPELHLVAEDGRVQIRPGPAGQIQIDVETEGWKIGPGEVRILESQSDNRVSYEVKEPHHWGLSWSTGHKRISIVATVPRDLDLSVVTGDGGVRVEELRGRIQIHTGDGRVEASNLRGELSLETGDGGIEAQGLDGRFSGTTGDGHLHLQGRFESLRVQSGDGPVVVEVEPGSEVTDEWRLSTGDGSLTLRLPSELRADLDASTGDGSIVTDFPIEMSGKLNEHVIHGRLNGGGAPITLRTGDGTIRIEGR
jgi:hypothetical protein